MIRAYFRSREWAAWAYGGGAFLLFSIWLQVQMTVLLNNWYRVFYDILQKATEHEIGEFWDLIFSWQYVPGNIGGIPMPVPNGFFSIAIPYVILAALTSYVTRLYGFRWREAITRDYIPRWRNVSEEIEGASQRIQEDAQRFARIVESLGLQIMRALMTLVAFLPILWQLSEQVELPVLRDIPGSLVWAALVISLGGMLISWFVGWFLPGLEYNNQKVEAAFRKELVLGEDDKVNHAKPETLFSLFTGLRVNYHRLYLHYGYFDLWAVLYAQVTTLTPLIMMGPGLFSGAVTIGLLTQVSNAYGRVDGAFSVILDNWTVLTELRSIWKRLHEFELNLDRFDTGSDVGNVVAKPAQ